MCLSLPLTAQHIQIDTDRTTYWTTVLEPMHGDIFFSEEFLGRRRGLGSLAAALGHHGCEMGVTGAWLHG